MLVEVSTPPVEQKSDPGASRDFFRTFCSCSCLVQKDGWFIVNPCKKETLLFFNFIHDFGRYTQCVLVVACLAVLIASACFEKRVVKDFIVNL